MSTTYTGTVFDTDAYVRANCRPVAKINGRLYVVRQFSMRQVLAFQQRTQEMDKSDEAGMIEFMLGALGEHLFPIEGGEPVGIEFTKDLDQDVALFLSNQLTSDKALMKAGATREELASRLGAWADFMVTGTAVDGQPAAGSSMTAGAPSESTTGTAAA